MTRVARETAHGAYLEDETGDERFVLRECPACGAPLNPERWPQNRGAEPADEHIGGHQPEDFGLTRDERDFQAKLPGSRGETA